jgi:uncharacterized MAPEG superfamily protein
MILAFWCVLIAGVMPIVCAYVAKFSKVSGASHEMPSRFDNREPRVWLAKQTGLRGRANAAQANCYEAFPFFAAGVIVAVLQHVPVATINLIAAIFIVARIAFVLCYMADRPSLRSTMWAIGFGATIWLFGIAATGTLR